ncbi:MAG: GGDEF domain-containing protein [Xanthomonadales bacterium]|nr:GGDEF domain-containing protein [Xanthomonadales bacterium]
MNTVKAADHKRRRTYISVVSYLVLLLGLVSSVFVVLAFHFKQQPQVEWLLVIIYAILAAMCYFFFIVNDLGAHKVKRRAMPMGFLLSFVALLLVTCSFIFDIPDNLSWYIAGVLLIAGYSISAYGLVEWAKHHIRKQQVMLHESLTDELTGLYNRRAFALNSDRELKFSADVGSDFTVMILDIDDFKPINDQHGHAVGDRVLQQISQMLQRYTRTADSIYRWGGEEFVVLMPVTGLFEANQLAQKIISKVANKIFQVDYETFLKLTISVGLAQWVEEESLVNDTLTRADKALYKAKANGKNNVVVADYIDSSHNLSKHSETNQVSAKLSHK